MLIRSGGVSFISKSSIQNIFLFGKVGKTLQCIFFDRSGSHEEKNKVVELIEERQKSIYEDKAQGMSLHICSEGFTTNNKFILPFKKGAFSSLLPVTPIAVKYSSSSFNPSHDVMPMGMHLIVLLSQITNSVEVTELPIFEPNEYLYKTHQKEGEEKWAVFARAVRESIADVLELPLSDATLKEKTECKDHYLDKKAKVD